jgi:MFS family permease
MFWGTLADHKGRRPFILLCLLILGVSCVGLALVPTDAYWLLMLLRCLQAAGSASTVALGSPSDHGSHEVSPLMVASQPLASLATLRRRVCAYASCPPE